MYHIILEVTASNGIKSKVRVAQEEVVTEEDVDHQEKYYTDSYSYPENVAATVTNVFYTPEEIEDA